MRQHEAFLGEGSSTRASQTPQLLHKNMELTLRGANSRALSAERGKDIVLVFVKRTVLNAEAVQGHGVEACVYKKISGL